MNKRIRTSLSLGLCTGFLCAGFLSACGPVQSGRWYDTERFRTAASVFFGKKSKKDEQAPRVDTAAEQTGLHDIIQVRAGDSYYKISRRYGVSVRMLIEANKARPPYHLQEGQKLVLPTNKNITIVKGDTLYSLSRRYGVDIHSLARHNNLSAPYHLRAGQKLYIQTNAVPQSARVASPKPQLPPTPARTGRFISPVQGQGRIISTYGGKENGLHNDGINIAVPTGTPVKAAENGVVVYAGSNLENYGNLLLIRHSGGYVTAYAHNSVFRVKQGDKVARGQVIAESGSTGNITMPQVHFEIRKGKHALDPQKLIES